MKLETFLEKFDQFADAPNAVAKLREFGLHLATHGKLVEQSQEDEPASNLIEQITKHFKLLRNNGELGGLPVEPLETEGLPDLPSTWQWVRLGNVAQYGSPDKIESADIPSDAWLLDLEDIEKDTSRLLQRKAFRDSPSKSTKTAFAVDDVLYGKLRPYLNKVLVADAPGYCTTEIVPIRTFGFVNPSYLRYALKRPEFLAYANSKSYGMNLPRLGTEDARRAALPLPPLAEQKRIVAKVDELMALCDRLEAQLQERDTQQAALARASLARFAEAPTPANLNFLFHDSFTIEPADLRKAIRTLAIQGKLALEKLYDGVEMQIGTIPPDRYKRVSGTGSSTPAPNSSDNNSEAPWAIPDSWRWIPLAEACRVITDGEHLTPTYIPSGVPILSAKHVGTKKLIWDDFKHVSESVAKKCWSRCKPEIGDILVVSRGGGIGRTIISDRDGYCLMGSVLLFKPHDFVLPAYLNIYLNSEHGNEYLRTTSGFSAQQAIYISHLKRDYILPLPPLQEQRRIVNKVDQLMALVDQLEAQLAVARGTATSLMNAVVAELTAGA